ncbi:esterase-like activity of phytase family protein [Ramlibacter ginsenosidimutans]|uniref:Esterase-like activity of phytase family protein n=1 Tax=Ramlibacter ginsenosidimutans TaxID=502333 RepID=A0A934WLW5_9BURK|nr:esterase-like activity of phytase family protein [Ramlibacter ginsenosidimutans]MBK6005853.1 esterase-like activity of phytase family protein [Ramlibacter ginsenosidimutans]
MLREATPSPLLTRRALLRGAVAASVLATVGCAERTLQPVARASASLRLLGEAFLPHRMDFKGTTVGGLSALDFDPATGLWVSLSDDRSTLQPARFYTLNIDVREGAVRVELLDVVTLRDAAGHPFPPRGSGGEIVDPEGMRLLPGARGVLWTSEGDYASGQPPMLREARLDGTHVRDFERLPMFQLPAPAGTGPRDNLTFEGLALTPDAHTAWVAMENALQQDGPVPGVGRPGGPCRITAFDLASGRAVRQVAYLPDAVPHASIAPGMPAENGISEILMIDAQRMLVLERAYVFGHGMSLRIYEIDTAGGSDTLAQEQLRAGEYRPCAKRLVADFATLGLSRLDNTEGMCWGPRLPNGRRSLVVVSDDNFRSAQVTQFAAFEYLEPA